VLAAPEAAVECGREPLGRIAVRVRERRLVPLCERGCGAQPAHGRCGRVRVAAVPLLPEVGGLTGNPVRLDRAEQEVRRPSSGRPQAGVQRLVFQLAPRGLVGEEDGARLVELVRIPRRRQRAVRPVALQPKPCLFLGARQPTKRTLDEVAAASREERKDEEREITRPDESVAAGAHEVGIQLRGRDHRAGLAIGERVEHEQRAFVQPGDGLLHRWLGLRDASSVTATPRVRMLIEADARDRGSAFRGLVSRRPERARQLDRACERARHRAVRARGRLRAQSERALECPEANDQPRTAGRARDAPNQRRLGRVHEVVDRHLEPGRAANRAKQHRSVRVGLLPHERFVVEPARDAVELDAEAELAELLLAIGMRPPEPLDAAALGKSRQERPVPEHGRRQRGVQISSCTERR